MNGDVICNGHSTTRNYLNHAKPTSAVHEEISIKVIQDGNCAGRHCTQKHVDGVCFSGGSLQPCPGSDARRRSSGGLEASVLKPEERAVQRSCRSEEQLSFAAELSASTPRANHRKQTCRKVKAKKSSKRGADNENSQNRKVTDYYPIRRSSRKSKAEIQSEEKKHIDELIINGIETGMTVRYIEGKGRGVFATQSFQKGQYLVEYHGDLLQITDAKEREAVYSQDPATGCYMYYFQYLSKTYCVDATKETGRMGRLINHSKNGNCQTKLHHINGIPHLILVASRDIDDQEELLYDYGDRSKASIAAHPWLKH